MLIMSIWTWDPKSRENIQSKATKKSVEFKAAADKATGVKMLGKWHDLSGNRMFMLQDVNDPMDFLTVNNDFLKVANVEYYTVIDDKDLVTKARSFGVQI